MSDRPFLSLVVPTRGRPGTVAAFLASLRETAERPDEIEVVLAIDSDDPSAAEIDGGGLPVRRVAGPPGRPMGRITNEAVRAARGAWCFLLNDDVLSRTKGWDARLREATNLHADGIHLVHADDGYQSADLAAFPILSRRMIGVVGRACPDAYRRGYIDLHIHDVFRRLSRLGHERITFLPDVLFEHLNLGLGRADSAVAADDEGTYLDGMDDRAWAARLLARAIETGGGGAIAR